MSEEKPNYNWNWDKVEAPKDLLWEKSFEYPLSLTFDECAARLQTFRDRSSWWFTITYYVNMTVTDQTLKAVIRQDSKRGTIYALLHAEMIGDGYLQLHFRVGAIRDLIYFVPVLLGAIILAILSGNLNAILVTVGFSIIAVISRWYELIRARQSLIRAIEKVF
jgi:hypothetical protein